MNKAYKYRIYPTALQSNMFIRTFGCCRKIWNLMLSDKIAYYEATGKMLYVTPAKYKNDYSFLKEADSLALANVQLNLESAYRAFFDRKRKVRNDFPKYKSAKRSHKSYTTNNQNGTVAIMDGFIKLPKIGKVKAVIHRFPDPDMKLKSATVSLNGDGSFYVSVLFEFEKNIMSVSKQGRALGLDYKSDGLYTDSEGNTGSNHKYFRESLTRLAKAQKKLSRKQGSKNNQTKSHNYLKQLKRINKIYRRTANRRLDSLHKKSTEITNLYDIVCVETLNMKAISNKDFKNGLATFDNGYGLFLKMLEYKLSDRGKYFVKVDKWCPSSQICHCCGNRQKLKLSDRIYKCGCGLVIDRDYNAAINIRNEGLRLLNTA